MSEKVKNFTRKKSKKGNRGIAYIASAWKFLLGAVWLLAVLAEHQTRLFRKIKIINLCGTSQMAGGVGAQTPKQTAAERQAHFLRKEN